MSDQLKIKKKLVIKKNESTGSISAKLAQKQKEITDLKKENESPVAPSTPIRTQPLWEPKETGRKFVDTDKIQPPPIPSVVVTVPATEVVETIAVPVSIVEEITSSANQVSNLPVVEDTGLINNPVPPKKHSSNNDGQPYQQRTDASGQPYQQRTDASGQPYQQRTGGTGQPYQQRTGGTGQPYQQRTGGTGQPYQQRTGGTGQPYQQRTGGTGQPYQQRTGGTGQPYQQRTGGTGQPYQQRTGGTGQPYQQRTGGTGQPYQQRTGGTGQPYQPRTPNPLIPVVPPAITSTSWQKTKLREELIKQEEHKKFFIRNQSRDANSKYNYQSSIPKEIKITEYIQVGELAKKMNLKTSDLLSKLMSLGVMVTITQSIDADTVSLVAEEFGCKVQVVSLYEETLIQEAKDDVDSLQVRSPIVTIMGHVDHGKTSLLDAIRTTAIAAQEAGGITQHIGAYQVSTPKGPITFLDTPGHEAFTAMRARGAVLTDIVVLVVAANDGVMPQTIEAYQHAKSANVPVIVAINKIDLQDANPEKVKQELSKYNLIPEEWGGETPFIEVSGLKKMNLERLKETIVAQAELMELKANPNRNAYGAVIEAKLDQGRGAVATVLIRNGTLKIGDHVIVGLKGGKVRAIFDSWGNKIKSATPSTPVEILGLNGVPQAGDTFHVIPTEKEMKDILEKREELFRQQQAQEIKKVKLENFNDAIEDGKVKELKIIIKADVLGSTEALASSLLKLGNSEVRVNVILSSSGEITESDVMLAVAANAIIIGFNTRANAKVRSVAESERISIYHYKIIYEAIDMVRLAMQGMLTPDIQENILGEANVRDLFKISALGTVAGCMVTSGIIKRTAKVRVIREGVSIYEGSLKALKRFKDDASEVREGFECGILIDGYNDLKVEDSIQCFELKSIARKMS